MKINSKRLVYKFYRQRLGIVVGVFTIGGGVKYTLASSLNFKNISLYIGIILLLVGIIFIIRSPKSSRNI